MGLARDYAPLPAWLLDADYGLDFAFYGASEDDPAEWPEGSTFSLHLAPAGRAKPAAGDVHELTTADGALVVAGHVVGIVSLADAHSAWSPGLYEVQLRRTGPEAVTEALYFGQVWLARGLSQLAELGGGDSAGIAGGQGVKVFRETGSVRILRGESAASVALASSSAADAAADRALVAEDRALTVSAAGAAAASAQGAGEARAAAVSAQGAAEAARSGSEAARDAAAVSAQAVPALKAHLGNDLSGVETTTIGGTVPDASNTNSSLTFGPSAAVASPGPLAAVHLRMSAPGAGEVQIFAPVGGGVHELVAIFPVTVSGGLNTLLDFGGYWLPAGSRVHYKWVSGGFLRYVAGGAGAYFNASAAVNLGDEALLATSANTVAMSFEVLADSNNLAGQVVAARAVADDAATDIVSAQAVIGEAQLAIGLRVEVETITGGSTEPDGATASASFCWFSKSHLTTLSRLDSFSARMSAAGSGLVLIVLPADGADAPVVGGSYELLAALPWTWSGAGDQTFTGFAGLVAPAGALLGFKAVSGGRPRYAASTSPGSWSTAAAAFVAAGDAASISSNNNTVALAFTASINGDALAPRLTALETGVALAGDDFNAPVYQVQERFGGAVLPEGWVETGGWTVAGGLVSPGLGGWNVAAYFDAYSSAGRRTLSARLEVLDAGAAFGLTSDPQEGYAGGQAIVDVSAGTLSLYTYDGTASAGTLVASAPLPAAVGVGDVLMLSVERDELVVTATCTNSRTQAQAVVEYDYSSSLFAARRPFFHGRPGVVDHAGGGVKVLHFATWANCVRRLDTLFIGDSNGEGSNHPTIGLSWMQQASALQSGRRLVCARGGDETPNFLERMASDLRGFRPRRVVLALGTNDTSLSIWRANMGTIIAAAEALGAEPILCTFPPRTGAQSLRNSQNADVMAGHFGRYRFIDLAAAVTDGNDRVTWDAAKVMADLIHMNAAGQAAAFAQAKIDVPELGVAAA